ncbi:MAG TPA: preprotein translocase subunit SecA, partial [Planctomycetaceae bacterium]|nr:preprotein translocase subunit SecA [Planctomycetaceae bacterium]
MRGFERAITTLFGSSNARYLRRLQPKVQAIGELEERYRAMSDAELKEQTAKFRARLKAGETLDDLLVEAFAVCREAGRRFLGMRHYDVQLIGGMVLHSGRIAEMVTGEGKTLVATLPAYLNALEGKGVHVVTVNDYLARRDMEWMAPLYMGLGITVGAIQSNMSVDERQAAYACDITYGTNNEFGFDYLRDNMRPAARGDDRFPKHLQQSQGPLNFAIIDEVDNILIDEARTPLIISGPAFDDPRKYTEADRIARQLVKDKHFTVNEKDHHVTLTDEGVRQAEKLAGVESFYTAGNMEWPHLIDNALKAHYLYKRDVNYVVKEGRVVIVDEFTGRLMEGRQWSDGLHQAVEAKEGVRIKEETQTLATITLQNFFKLYKKLAGMTGTAMTEATEFWKIYKLDVIAIPTNRPLQRIEHPDVIYATEREKYEAVADEIERLNKWDEIRLKSGEIILGQIERENDAEIRLVRRGSSSRKNLEVIRKEEIADIQRRGRPVLVGTVSIEKSERLSKLLDQRGIRHEVLNAKYHKREAEIVAQAGRLGAVTIATNMAGRGTDIILGGNPETMAWARLQDKYPTRLDVPREEWDALVAEIEAAEKMKEEAELVKSLGGLHVIGTERHEARRIDLQLRGRCGRQGDPGSSRFYLSLEDDLMRIFAGPWIQALLKKSLPEGEPLESKMVTRRVEGAQKKVEERNFEIRKNLLEYDEVMDEQRKRVYSYRQQILDGANCRHMIEEMLREEIAYHVDMFMDRDYGVESFAQWAGNRLGTTLDGRDFRGMDFSDAEALARDEA